MVGGWYGTSFFLAIWDKCQHKQNNIKSKAKYNNVCVLMWNMLIVFIFFWIVAVDPCVPEPGRFNQISVISDMIPAPISKSLTSVIVIVVHEMFWQPAEPNTFARYQTSKKHVLKL